MRSFSLLSLAFAPLCCSFGFAGPPVPDYFAWTTSQTVDFSTFAGKTVNMVMIGGGGGGGGGHSGGGGSGYLVQHSFTVPDSASLQITVGQGGAGGSQSNCASGSFGTQTKVCITNGACYVANGGGPGVCNQTPGGGNGGSGGGGHGNAGFGGPGGSNGGNGFNGQTRIGGSGQGSWDGILTSVAAMGNPYGLQAGTGGQPSGGQGTGSSHAGGGGGGGVLSGGNSESALVMIDRSSIHGAQNGQGFGGGGAAGGCCNPGNAPGVSGNAGLVFLWV